jgi:hypothetical protein
VGNKLFGVDVARIIRESAGPWLDATLITVTPGARTVGNLTAGTNPTEASTACKGFITSQGLRNKVGTLVEDGIKTIVLIGDTISDGTVVPEVGDKVTIEGATYRVEAVDRDPAAAAYTLATRAI